MTLERWFQEQDWRPFDFQREVRSHYLAGRSGLIHAATGTGKTYAAWLGPVSEWLDSGERSTPPLRVLWITPLRALAADTEAALRAPLEALGIPWTLESRTGDTPQKVRAKQRRRLPSALVTTPESLTLFLARAEAPELFRHLRMVVVDEWHELMSSKRGVQTELALARLKRCAPDVRIWGLSATLGNTAAAMETLLGDRPGELVRGLVPKTVLIDSIIPETVETFPWSGHLGLTLLPSVLDAIEEGRTTLVFTNTRSQTETWYQAILEARPQWAGHIALHHGSLERRIRDYVEDGLKQGLLRCVVCTSSLDLGVDFTPVDRVLQIGSPKGVARLLQRAGRSGHRPGVPSRVTVVPTNALELIEVAAARDAAAAGEIESRYPVERPLDVLAQHAVTMAVAGGFDERELFDEVRATRAYRGLTRAEWEWVLEFVAHGGAALRAYPEYARVVQGDDGRYRIADAKQARRHLLSIGTITSDAAIEVRYLTGGRLGSVEENFIAKLRPGDRFVFAGKTLEFVRVRNLAAWVRRAKGTSNTVPRWDGGRMPLSSELSAAVRRRLQAARESRFDAPEMEAVREILAIQASESRVPAADELLVESVKTREGYHLFLFPFEGRLVHEGLAALLAYRLSRVRPVSFSLAVNDYGLELLSPDPVAFDPKALSPEGLVDDIPASLNAAEMARRQFREVARVAGLVFDGFPGRVKTMKQFQASSGLLYDVFARYDPGNLLLHQAHREVLERQLESSRLADTLRRLSRSRILRVELKRPSPLSFPILTDRTRHRVSSEKLADRVKRMRARPME